MKNEEKNNDNHQKEGTKQKMKQITNSEVKTDPVVDVKLAIKQSLAGVSSRVMEAPLS